ncbi:alpha-L-rhamnosidase C-terminal domain-containing protein [Paenibacillus sp. 1P07SE]|uniref:alpha-L-rhamnosidase C-terminal domain-containing protein n=1 Tax=Paenibacillus sp. 1P07SE TaxID=3132209 RepID=UPI0039A5DAA5
MTIINQVPRWIWHHEGERVSNFVLSRVIHLEEDVSGLALHMSLTGEALILVDGQFAGRMEEKPSNVAALQQISGFPSSLKSGEHRVDIQVLSSAPMPVKDVSIHLSNRLVGILGYLTGDDLYLPTDEAWEIEGSPASVICHYGDEPYGDLENSPDWFSMGGYGEIESTFIQRLDIVSTNSTVQAQCSEGKLNLSGTLQGTLCVEKPRRKDKYIFYHLRKQLEWKELRESLSHTGIESLPSITIRLDLEYNARFCIHNQSDLCLSIVWMGAESMYELDHYDSVITEAFEVKGGQSSCTLPQGLRYVKLYFLGAVGGAMKASIQFEALNARLNQQSVISTDVELVNRIFNTSVHTNRVCHQIGLWDGIKRDRLNWAYDFYLAGKADYVLWEDLTILKRAIEEIGRGTPYGYWMNAIASYTFWWINNVYEYYLHTGDALFLIGMKDDVHKHIQWIEANIDEEQGGLIPGLPTLLEWVPITEVEAELGMQALFRLTADNLNRLAKWVPELELRIDWAWARLTEEDFLTTSSLIVPLLGIISGYVSEHRGRQFLTSYELKDPITPLSSFWLAECYSNIGLHDKAWETIKQVWGKMLDQDATTFWEGILLSDEQADFHRGLTTYTAYDSYRMSLCHSWSSTPVQWLTKYVLGVQPLEPGYRKVRFSPQAVGGMQKCTGDVGTPLGAIKVEWELGKNGQLQSSIKVPDEVLIEYRSAAVDEERTTE